MPDNTKIKLPPSLVRVGQEVPVDVYARNGLLLVKKGHYVLTPEQKERILHAGQVTVDAQAALSEREERERRARLAEAERRAQERLREANPLLEMDQLTHRCRGLLNHFYAMREVEQSIRRTADQLIRLAETGPDGLIAACLLVPFNDYGSTHSLHSAAILAVLGRRMKLPPPELQTLLCAALTMNIGATQLHTELSRQDGPLNPEQRAEMQAHPLLASAVLRDLGIEDERWHLLVQQHHEEYGGGGYPYGLRKEEIDPGAHLVRLADVLTSLLVTHAHRPGHLPSIALGRLFRGEFAEFDPTFVALLIKELGIYPPGSFVKLANHEYAVVTHRPSDGKTNQPRVAALRSPSGEFYGEPHPRNTRLPEFSIVGPISLAQAGVRPSFLVPLWAP
ncbi:HD-GYP domain, c-di-GMP phosphodiesterase class II (or its inactivated variant) [Gulbenkiania indica]|uniref:HD-GYP domain, c-di-GMP phosphodiesterase class II (Or its inactivated variant) n=1 Tax=Gulbenkiania indica TaxID=375574 RepID=A0A0K6H5N8_9NEIS|nr:HD domain-containing phosphohydrolase [Gulbenkiania indica]CUA86304.1 HD-GYP domain, c-di-GMP phosphodiesterase class II (or its inactivated variant) [Gulbenkiania indica]